jgi:protein-S-isoprenylcysteine O-methyltransferase Ste14
MFVVLGFFGYFISDFRHKGQMIPLVDKRLALMVKLSYLIPLSILAYTLVTMDTLLPVDLIALIGSCTATYVVGKAKVDLATYHTAAGYYANADRFVNTGIYSYIRHPLYTGIYLFSFFTFTPVAFRVPWYLTMTVILVLGYILIYLLTAARLETQRLTEQFGTAFVEYKERVHPFLPLRRFNS